MFERFSPVNMLLMGIILLLTALIFSALSLQMELSEVEIEKGIPLGSTNPLAKVFNIDFSKKYSRAILIIDNNTSSPIDIELVHPSGVMSQYRLEPSRNISIEVINLLSILRIQGNTSSSIYGMLKLTMVENKYGWMIFPSFILFIVGTVILSVGVMTYWMEKGLRRG